MKVAIVGSRGFDIPGMVAAIVQSLVHRAEERGETLTVFSGGARGVDEQAREACVELGFHVCNSNIHDEPVDPVHHLVEYLAMWRDPSGKLDRGAGFRRNRRIVAEADMVIALFADGPRTPGTSNTVRLAVDKGVPVHIWHEGRWERG